LSKAEVPGRASCIHFLIRAAALRVDKEEIEIAVAVGVGEMGQGAVAVVPVHITTLDDPIRKGGLRGELHFGGTTVGVACPVVVPKPLDSIGLPHAGRAIATCVAQIVRVACRRINHESGLAKDDENVHTPVLVNVTNVNAGGRERPGHPCGIEIDAPNVL
jgi:hypothetical protein